MLYPVKAIFVVVILALAAAPAAAARHSSKAALHLVSPQPLVVRGTGFFPGERVRLTLRTGDDVIYRRATASPAGVFRSSFGTVTIGRCGGFSIRAATKRHAAALKTPPLPACMPERSP